MSNQILVILNSQRNLRCQGKNGYVHTYTHTHIHIQFFGEGKVSRDRDTLIKFLCTTYIGSVPQGKILLIFLKDTLNTGF